MIGNPRRRTFAYQRHRRAMAYHHRLTRRHAGLPVQRVLFHRLAKYGPRRRICFNLVHDRPEEGSP